MSIGYMKWLKAWLNLPFYEEKCKILKHEKQHKTVYCTTCMEPPVCEKCWLEKSSEHQDHKFLKVTTASRRPAIYIDTISEYLDVSNIQNYKNNGKLVVYLKGHEKEKEEESSKEKEKEEKSSKEEESSNSSNKRRCKACRAKLMDAKDYCSINCMINEMPEMECTSLRRRRRKGFPLRGPMY